MKKIRNQKSNYNYFRMPNIIFDYFLSPSELIVIAYFFSIIGYSNLFGKCVKVKQATIARKCHMSVQVVARTLDSLMTKGLITTKIRTIKSNGHLSTCSYAIKEFPMNSDYFTVDRKVFRLLNSKQMRLYLYIAKCIDVKAGECYKSYTDIANELCMKRSTVVALMGELVNLGFIRKTKKITKCGDYTENHYSIVSIVAPTRIRRKRGQKKMCHLTTGRHINAICKAHRTSKLSSSSFKKYNTTHLRCCQELFYCLRGSP